MHNKFHFECCNCGEKYDSDKIIYLCTSCEKENDKMNPPKGVLKAIYNYDKLKHNYGSLTLFDRLEKNDFIDLLPIHSHNSLSYLKVGQTPLYEIISLNSKMLNFRLILKDDSQNPTFSFKDRASNIVSAYAKEHGISTIAAASTGNAGSSLAGICASQNQKAIVFVPAKAPIAKLTQILMYGAQIVPVNGTYDDAFDLSIEATKEFGWYNRNTAFNPITIEGKKTVSFEIAMQLRKLPDRIFVPVGDGVIISGVFKGFEDLLKIGLIEKIPIIVAVQAEGSSNIVNNITSNAFEITPSNTIADSISVDIPRNFFMTKKFLKQYRGEAVTVSDSEIMEASVLLSRNTGIFTEPAAAAAFAGLLKYKSQDMLKPNSKNLVLLTGSGLKDLNAVKQQINMPAAIQPEISELKKLLKI